MRLPPTLALSVATLALAGPARAGDMKELLQIDPANVKMLRSKFGVYGPRPARCLVFERSGVRVSLPAGMTGVSQTGIYSMFSLAGDCEVTCSYELLNLPTPQTGYGCGMGLAFDAGEDEGRGLIQRLQKPKESGFVLQTSPARTGSQLQEEYRFVPSSSKRGRIGLRRIDRELIFLAANTPTGTLEEVGRLPFMSSTIGAVRFFADTGESPTAVSVRFRDIMIWADEIAGGVPLLEQEGWSRWWFAALLAPVAALVWHWRRRVAATQRRDRPTFLRLLA